MNQSNQAAINILPNTNEKHQILNLDRVDDTHKTISLNLNGETHDLDLIFDNLFITPNGNPINNTLIECCILYSKP